MKPWHKEILGLCLVVGLVACGNDATGNNTAVDPSEVSSVESSEPGDPDGRFFRFTLDGVPCRGWASGGDKSRVGAFDCGPHWNSVSVGG